MTDSKTHVQQVRGGDDCASYRFTLISEVALSDGAFWFQRSGVEMTLAEVCDALVAHGISEPDTLVLINDAVASFETTYSYPRS